MLTQKLLTLNKSIFNILLDQELLKNKLEISKSLANQFYDLGFKDFIVLIAKTDSTLEKVYSNNESNELIEHIDWTIELNTHPKAPFIIKKISLDKNEETAICIPMTFNSTLLGMIILAGVDETKIEYYSEFFMASTYSLITLFYYMQRSQIYPFNIVGNQMQNRLSLLNLNEKQVKVAELLLSGGTNKDIAAAINVSEQAIKYHVGNMLDIFNCKNRKELKIKIKELIF